MEYLSSQQLGQPVVFAAGDEHLPAGDAVQHKFLPPGVQLTEHIIQQQHRILPGGVFVDFPLRQLQRQRRRPGLALGGVALGVPSVNGDQKVILMGPGQTQPGP